MKILATQYSFSDPWVSTHTNPAPTWKTFVTLIWSTTISHQLVQSHPGSPGLPAQVGHEGALSDHALALGNGNSVLPKYTWLASSPVLQLEVLLFDQGSLLQVPTKTNHFMKDSFKSCLSAIIHSTCTRYLPLSKGITLNPVPKTFSFLVARNRSSSVISWWWLPRPLDATFYKNKEQFLYNENLALTNFCLSSPNSISPPVLWAEAMHTSTIWTPSS